MELQYKYIPLEKIGKLSMLNIPWTLILNSDLVLGIVKGWVLAGRVTENKNQTWTRKIIAYLLKFKQLSLDSDNCSMLEQYYPLDLVLGNRAKIVLPTSLYGQAIFAAHNAKTAGGHENL